MSRDRDSASVLLRVLGGGLLFATAGIHLDLYLTGYHSIPTIGVLFFLQVISAFALAASVLARGGLLLSVSAAGFCASTIGGYLLSRWVGLFGFKEVATTAGLVAGLVEVGGLLVFGALVVAELPSAATAPGLRALRLPFDRVPQRPAGVALGLLVAAALALTLAGGIGTSNGASSVAGASSPPTGSGSSHSSITITITNFTFSPTRVTVAPGERITVVNKDSVAHTLTAVPGSRPFGNFNTGSIEPNASGVITAPMQAGTYQYLCSIHNFMTGTITVS